MTNKIRTNFSFSTFYVWLLTKCQSMQVVFLGDRVMLCFCALQTSLVNHRSETPGLLPMSRHTDRPWPSYHQGCYYKPLLTLLLEDSEDRQHAGEAGGPGCRTANNPPWQLPSTCRRGKPSLLSENTQVSRTLVKMVYNRPP